MLPNAEAKVATGTVGPVEIFVRGDVVERRAVKIGAAGDEQRQLSGNALEHVLARGARRQLGVGREQRNFFQEVRRARLVRRTVQQCGLGGVGLAPRGKGLLPLVVAALEPFLVVGEIGADLVAHIEMLRGQAEALAGGVGELRPTLAVAFRGAGDFGNALRDDGLRDDELRLAARSALGLVDRLEDRGQVVAVSERLHVPVHRLEARGGVLALRFVGHGVERDVVRVVNEDEIVEALVAGEFAGLHRDAFLHAAVAGEADDMVVENLVARRVETRGRHLAGHRHADRVANALPERAGGGLDSGGLAEFGVARGLAVQDAEILHLLERQLVAAQVQPAVEEHRTVARGEDEAVAIQPARLIRIVHERMAVEHRADLSTAQRQAKVAGGALVDRVDGEAAGLVGSLGKNLSLEFHGKE